MRGSARKYEGSSTPSRAAAEESVLMDSPIGGAEGDSASPLPPDSLSTKAPIKRELSVSGNSRRLKLLVHTGSCRIVMTGEVYPEHLQSDPALQDALTLHDEHGDVMVVDEDRERRDTDDGATAGGETITVSQSVLFSNADHVHYSKQNDSGQCSHIEDHSV